MPYCTAFSFQVSLRLKLDVWREHYRKAYLLFWKTPMFHVNLFFPPIPRIYVLWFNSWLISWLSLWGNWFWRSSKADAQRVFRCVCSEDSELPAHSSQAFWNWFWLESAEPLIELPAPVSCVFDKDRPILPSCPPPFCATEFRCILQLRLSWQSFILVLNCNSNCKASWLRNDRRIKEVSRITGRKKIEDFECRLFRLVTIKYKLLHILWEKMSIRTCNSLT